LYSPFFIFFYFLSSGATASPYIKPSFSFPV
jgi:hypothetical protein